MVRTKYLRRHYVEKHLKALKIKGKVLEIGSGEKWRYVPNSITLNNDADAKPDKLSDAEHMDFPDNEFNFILCLEVIEHTPHPRKLIAEAYRTLKPGGSLILSAPFNLEVHAENDFWRFTKKGFEELLKNFSSADIFNTGGKGSLLAHMIRRGKLGKYAYPFLNNVGFLIDTVFQRPDPIYTLGYFAVATK